MVWYSVREVHYNDDGTIYAYTIDPARAQGDSIKNLKEYLQWCLDALDKPILIDGKVEFVDYEKMLGMKKKGAMNVVNGRKLKT